MELTKVTLSRFKSFVKPVTFQLARTPGLILITGDNKVDPALTGNGAGKTTLFDAVTFCLYGMTGSGERGPKLVSDTGTGPANVTVTGRRNQTKFTVSRSQSPNSLTIHVDGKERTVTQEEVDDLLGMTYKEFTRGCYHVQGTIGFVGLKPQGMLDEFSSYLSLDVYDQAQATANSRWVLADNKRRTLETTIAGSRRLLAELRDSCESLGHKAHEESRQKLHDAVVNREQCRATRGQLRAAQGRLAAIAEGSPHEALEARLEAAKAVTRKARKAQQLTDYVVRGFERDWDDLNKLIKDTVCPTCGQKWERSDLARVKRAELKPVLEGAYKEQTDVTTRLEVATEHQKKLEEKLRNKSDTSIDEIARTETEIKHLSGEFDRLLTEGEAIAKRGNQALAALRRLELTAERTKEELAEQTKDLERATEDAAGYGYWRKGFKLLKLEVIGRTVAHFQAVAGDNLASLGMENWSLTIDADSALDGKGKLQVALLHTSGSNRTPVDLSYGENQRVKIAVDMAVGDVCLAAGGVTTNVEFWDEPMAWLSANGITMFLEMLERRAATLGRTIYVSDHRTLDYNWLDRITITRDRHGSKVKQAVLLELPKR